MLDSGSTRQRPLGSRAAERAIRTAAEVATQAGNLAPGLWARKSIESNQARPLLAEEERVRIGKLAAEEREALLQFFLFLAARLEE